MGRLLCNYAVMLRLIAVGTAAILGLAAQTSGIREYTDAARGFRFTYPIEFGRPAPGTDDGFGDRVAAVRFSAFSVLGGEAALTQGFPVIDMQAVGGLYDSLGLAAFPAALRPQIVQALPRLTPANFCAQLGTEQHLDVTHPALAKLPEDQRNAVVGMDRMRNAAPRVVRCDVEGTTVTFHKEVSFLPGGPRQHIYGAVRFLDAPFSTFQLVRAGPPPDAGLLRQMAAVVNSWQKL